MMSALHMVSGWFLYLSWPIISGTGGRLYDTPLYQTGTIERRRRVPIGGVN
jgi:hypothetical protein